MKLTPTDHPNRYLNLWQAAEVEVRIQEGIEKHRKGDAEVRVVGADGQARPGAEVRVRQTSSSFHFGANIFKLGGYETGALNRAYEDAFLGLFNGATVPFYWKTLEPAPGQLRFTADSEPVDRRPPPDVVVEFCRDHGLRMHGHTLVWSFCRWSIPEWLSRDEAECARLIEKRIREIGGERYGDTIKRWDVLNEATSNYGKEAHPMIPDYEGKAFEWATRYFPDDVRFDINETNGAWNPKSEAYFNLIKRLRGQGARVGAIGKQFHLFSDEELGQVLEGKNRTPQELFESLDRYAMFDLPIHISEITLTSPGNTPQGLEDQAAVARNFYRLWFSHPSVEGITWWNVPDGGAAPGEDTVFSGLLYGDLTPKPSYHALQRLIHEEWRTETSGVTDADGRFAFRGFHGDYSIEVPGRADQETLKLSPGGSAAITIHL